jgi:hypothetical protein
MMPQLSQWPRRIARDCPTGPVTTFGAMMGTKGEVHYIHGEDPFAGGGTANLTTRAAARVCRR